MDASCNRDSRKTTMRKSLVSSKYKNYRGHWMKKWRVALKMPNEQDQREEVGEMAATGAIIPWRKTAAPRPFPKWSKEDTFALITLFESFPELWDASKPEYRDRARKSDALKHIAEEMRRDEKDISNKLFNLRCQYNGEVRKLKIKNSEADGKERYVCRWDFFNALKFMFTQHDSVPQAVSNITLAESEENMDDSSMTREHVAKVASEGDVATPSASIKRKSKFKSPREAVLSRALALMDRPADDSQLFCDYLASQMRKLSEGKWQKLEQVIQETLWSVRAEPEHKPTHDAIRHSSSSEARHSTFHHPVNKVVHSQGHLSNHHCIAAHQGPARNSTPKMVSPMLDKTVMLDAGLKMKIKQELQEISDSMCTHSSVCSAYENGARSLQDHILEDGQQFASLCEVCMSPSPSNIKGHQKACEESDEESVFNDIAIIH